MGRKISIGSSNGNKTSVVSMVGNQSASADLKVLSPSESGLLLRVSQLSLESGNISHYTRHHRKKSFHFFWEDMENDSETAKRCGNFRNGR